MNIKRRIEKLENAKGIGIPKVLSNKIPYIFGIDEDKQPIIEEFYRREGINPDDYDIVINRCFIGTDDSKFGWRS